MKILTVAGTRPQLVKIAAVSRILRKEFTEILVNTGQHYDYNLDGIFFDELDIPRPDYNLGVGSETHGIQTGKMMIKLEEIFERENPDLVLVYGDTNSTLSGALVASKRLIPLIHIEAGLRSYNKAMPEEQNRIVTDHLSNLLFVPSKNAIKNLSNEDITKGIYLVGDVMMDAVLYNIKLAKSKYSLNQFKLSRKEYILGTIHRAENTNNKSNLESIIKGFGKVDKTVYLPLHPRTRNIIRNYKLEDYIKSFGNIKIVEPVSYLEMLFLIENSYAVVTDSGGLQKEAYFLKVPCLTLREQTEWVETVEEGWNKLVNPLRDSLEKELKHISNGSDITNLYGDGEAAVGIVEILKREYMDNLS